MTLNTTFQLFATTPKGMEDILARELEATGASEIGQKPSGVVFSGSLETAYRACLWSRTANRILLPLAQFSASDDEQLYQGIQNIDWSEHMYASNTLAVDCTLSHSTITHSQYASQRIKDAIVDQFRERDEERPSVDLKQPDIRINVFIQRNRASVSLDLSGDSLHKRGYRVNAGAAPLKENLAAALLLKAGWQDIAAQGGMLIDPLCGSGTLLIEGAMIAGDIAPALQREIFGFQTWKQHQPVLWDALLEEARQRKAAGAERIPRIIGYEIDARVVHIANDNIAAADLLGCIHVEKQDLLELNKPAGKLTDTGLLISNPPYGERLGAQHQILEIYRHLGRFLKQHCLHWHAAILANDSELGYQTGLRSRKPFNFYNGALECCLLRMDVEEKNFLRTPEERLQSIQLDESAQMLANRLRKNLKNTGRWAKQNNISCYRLYDADLPEYSVAIDIYQTEQRWVHIQEYEAPKSIDPSKAEQRLQDVLLVVRKVLEVPQERAILKVRRKQKGQQQYEKQDTQQTFLEVEEGPARLLVNLTDYLDTGLFLDHRPTRERILEQAAGMDFLNLFAYTGSVTVYAALGRARSTTSVDMSATYLKWAENNLNLNVSSGNKWTNNKHRFIQSDCIEWMKKQVDEKGQRYDIIFLDPPTFSNSKRMAGTFDIQRDHVFIIKLASRLLKRDGVLIFSTNRRKFKLEMDAFAYLTIKDITRETLPRDFQQRANIHQCWEIRNSGRG